MDVPFIDQQEDWPTGCESVSAVMLLRYLGSQLSVDGFIDRYLPRADSPWEDENGILVGADPREFFLGDPRTESGWGCMAPVIVRALQSALADGALDQSCTVTVPEVDSLEELTEEYVSRGIPVAVWASVGMQALFPDRTMQLIDTEEKYQWYYPQHCLVLVGQEQDGYLFNDPMAGRQVTYEKAASEAAFATMGFQAVALVPEAA